MGHSLCYIGRIGEGGASSDPAGCQAFGNLIPICWLSVKGVQKESDTNGSELVFMFTRIQPIATSHL